MSGPRQWRHNVARQGVLVGATWITVEFPDMPCGEHGIIVKVNGEFFEDYGFVYLCEEEGGGEEGGHDK